MEGCKTASSDDTVPPAGDSGHLPRQLCRVMGLNQNHSSRSGTSYHVQIEDRGPIFDEAAEEWVRRVNVIAYANYGEPTARIVYGKDHDFPDLRTREHNQAVAERVQELAREARQILEEKEERQVGRIKQLLQAYYRSREERLKREIEDANALSPFVFARAFQELKTVRHASSEAPPPPPEETVYPLDAAQREIVLDIERVAEEMRRDLETLRERGAADAILQATCLKLLARARDSLARKDSSAEFATRYLDMTRNSLVTAYRQVRARLGRLPR
jgi:hypothetical protein